MRREKKQTYRHSLKTLLNMELKLLANLPTTRIKSAVLIFERESKLVVSDLKIDFQYSHFIKTPGF